VIDAYIGHKFFAFAHARNVLDDQGIYAAPLTINRSPSGHITPTGLCHSNSQ
jgi:hypothetical protein